MSLTLLAVGNPGTIVRDALIPNTRDGGNHPHLVNIFVPQVYDKAVVCLHGGGGTKGSFMSACGLLTGSTISIETVKWSVLNARAAIAIFPQGQHCNPSNAGPWNPNGVDTVSALYPSGVGTWSNRHMWSGADDPQFLIDLSTYIDDEYPAATAKVLAGHSNGGMMVNRAWYELPDSYTHFCSVSGPAAMYYDTAALPTTVRPFASWIGDNDIVIGIKDGRAGEGNHFEDDEWLQQIEQTSQANVDFPGLGSWVGELKQMQRRLTAIGGGTLGDGVVQLANNVGTRTEWEKYAGQILLRRMSWPQHGLQFFNVADGNTFVRWCLFAGV